MSRSGDSCTTCVARRRKCDRVRPLCRHCARDGVECGGYSGSKISIRGVSGPRKSRAALPISLNDVIDFVPSGLVSAGNYSEPLWASNISSSEPGTPSEWSNVGNVFSSPAPYLSPTSHPSLDPLLAINLQPSVPIPRQAPAPPYRPTDIGPFDEVTRTFLPPKKDVRKSMTPGQGTAIELILRIRMMHKKVKSNTLPFVLQSYALWMRQFLFEPIRIIPLAKEYTVEEYSGGPANRWRMVTISNAVRAITGSAGYTLEDLEILHSNMHRGFAVTFSNFGKDRAADRINALLAMSTTYEFISVSVKVLPLSKLVKTMQAVAPIFRRGCPDPDDRPVNLPSLLSNINVGLEYYATVDVLLSAVISRPMNFRYDTTYASGVYESIFDLENGPGTRWVYGVPDRLLILFARMNTLLEEFGSCVDSRMIRDLEMEIKEAKSIVVASTDPSLAIGRMVVQECWRQVAYIYLYMGLCGADSHDARALRVHGDFMEIFLRTKPGRIPDSFLVFPLPTLGIATRHPDDQELLKRRMLALPECARKGTAGNQFIRMLEYVRLASLYVAGV
ncbi:unnamed protein product [Rhizoctonia solani]|nr:unnamed protein product [Rhizoctonia solani]